MRDKTHADECKSKLNKTNPLLVTRGIPTGNVTYPVVVVVEGEGIKCRALLDTASEVRTHQPPF